MEAFFTDSLSPAPFSTFLLLYYTISSRKRVNKKMRDCVDLDSKVFFNHASDIVFCCNFV